MSPSSAASLSQARAHLAPARPAALVPAGPGFDIPLGADMVRVELSAADTLHVQFRRAGHAPTPTLVVDPAPQPAPRAQAELVEQDGLVRLHGPQLEAVWDKRQGVLSIGRPGQAPLLRQFALPSLAQGRLSLIHAKGEPMYGIGGYDATEPATAGLLRDGYRPVTAGEQGHAGAPFVWTTAGYGVLIDGVGGQIALGDSRIDARMFDGGLDYYVFLGDPHAIFGALARVSGRTPLFPKWAMGFTNSQWGIDQKELLDIVHGYRERHIPLDNFTLDFDWKAWGQDDYGEFRWNPEKFPDGSDGKLKARLDALGVHLTGIMKPRIHVDTIEGREATEHDYWLAQSDPAPDYFSGKTVRELDFSKPQTRAWFFNAALKHSFETGIVGWWNDEADDVAVDLQHMDMQRALYDGQRAISDLRVWSLNRNFYLGAQRYAYGLWSGDIPTGFASMAGQRQRMLSAINVGAMQWGMDGGGFKGGTPSPENYARWIQFGAFTPVFRVHGEFNQKRQPWVYGPVAEKAAAAAIRLRQSLIPYIYSYEHQRRATGVGLVRPLLFDWPNDPNVRNDVDAWLFGDSLLVSPVVEQGQTRKSIYLPQGEWIDWFSGRRHAGGRTVEHVCDAQGWTDIPLFVREGAIIPVQPPEDYVGQHPLTTLEVELFPAASASRFDYYDDDGRTYAYEQGQYFLQALSMQAHGERVEFALGAPQGGYHPALRTWLLKFHGAPARAVRSGGRELEAFGSEEALRTADGDGWATGQDRFGPVTYVRVSAGLAQNITLER
ncbi:TIM-barrel domain-containing protein [Fulvimonas yonginensis]|uniref:TIM-barrel domain-containing protein n=1 Tax=Fulvimonas yonginensis TaxID=1495200 RepID=A0ABU8JEH6_9GAMM